jgi:hypothetical protein
MKKTIVSILILAGLNPAFSQTKEQVTTFLSDRTMPFNKDVKAVEVNNLDSVIRSCSKRNISCSHNIFTLYGTSFAPAQVIGGYGQTIIKDKKLPFVMYTFYKENGNTIIEVVSGSDSL